MVLALLSFGAPQNRLGDVLRPVLRQWRGTVRDDGTPAATPLQHARGLFVRRSFEVSDTAAVFTCRLKVIFSEAFFG